MALYLVSVPVSEYENVDETRLKTVVGEGEFVRVWEGMFFVDSQLPARELRERLHKTPHRGLVALIDQTSFSGRAPIEAVQWYRSRSQG